MENADTSIIFNGYQEIWSSFWQFAPVEDSAEVRKSKFWQSPVVFLNADELSSGHVLYKLLGGLPHEVVRTITVKGEKFEIFSLCGDGGFQSCLFLAEDKVRLEKVLS